VLIIKDQPVFLFHANGNKIMKKSYYTKEGLQKIKDELNDLKTRGRADMSKQIAEARDKGDLSENAEYDAAKDAQGLMEMKISQLEGTVANAQILDDSNIDTSKVAILSNVSIKNAKNGMKVTYTLVAEEEADLKANKISIDSPIAKGLLGKKVGEKALVKVPAGNLEFEVLEITR
jgi:transcription elongation factor GreA